MYRGRRNAKVDIYCISFCNSVSNFSVFCCLAVDEAGKMVTGDGEKVTMEAALEEQDGEDKDEDGQEVIKVYIFKADSGEEDLGKI